MSTGDILGKTKQINKNRGDVSKHERVDSPKSLFSQRKHRKIEQSCQNQVGQNSGT